MKFYCKYRKFNSTTFLILQSVFFISKFNKTKAMKTNSFYLCVLIAFTIALTACNKKPKASSDDSTKQTESSSDSNSNNSSASNDNSDKGKGFKRYDVKSGTVELEPSGTMNSGKETLHFDYYGRKRSQNNTNHGDGSWS